MYLIFRSRVGYLRAKCCLCERLIWPTSEFSLPNVEYKIALKRSFMMSRYLRWHVIRRLYYPSR